MRANTPFVSSMRRMTKRESMREASRDMTVISASAESVVLTMTPVRSENTCDDCNITTTV